MYKYILPLSFLLSPTLLGAQEAAPTWAAPSEFVKSVEKNNTTLIALRGETTAQQKAARAEAVLGNPEAEVAHLRGTPGSVGRTNVSFSQPLDWGMLTGRRRKVAEAQGHVAEVAFDETRRLILAEADAAEVNYVFARKMLRLQEMKTKQAEKLAGFIARRYELGNATQLELNKVRLNYTLAQAQLKRAAADCNNAFTTLQRLNGGKSSEEFSSDTLYNGTALPTLPEVQQYALSRHTSLKAASALSTQRKEELKLNRSLQLPELSVGFTGEYMKDTKFSGVSLGMSLPLWGGSRRKVKQSQAAYHAAQLSIKDAEVQVAAEVAQQHQLATSLETSSRALKAEIENLKSEELLHKSLEAGQITVVDYLMEFSFFYDAREAHLQAERDARLAESELRSMCY